MILCEDIIKRPKVHIGVCFVYDTNYSNVIRQSEHYHFDIPKGKDCTNIVCKNNL